MKQSITYVDGLTGKVYNTKEEAMKANAEGRDIKLYWYSAVLDDMVNFATLEGATGKPKSKPVQNWEEI